VTDGDRGAAHRRPRRPAPGIPQLAPRRLVKPFPPADVLDADRVETIHQASDEYLDRRKSEIAG
jgi:trimethylamine:corrinoid methyltransferase-like protein